MPLARVLPWRIDRHAWQWCASDAAVNRYAQQPNGAALMARLCWTPLTVQHAAMQNSVAFGLLHPCIVCVAVLLRGFDCYVAVWAQPLVALTPKVNVASYKLRVACCHVNQVGHVTSCVLHVACRARQVSCCKLHAASLRAACHALQPMEQSMVSSPLEEIAEAETGLSGSDQMSALQEILLERFPDGGAACNMQHNMQHLMKM